MTILRTLSIKEIRALFVSPIAYAVVAGPPVAGVRVLGVAIEGLIDGGTRPMRAVAVGDGDFASNSFFPYMANSDLLLAVTRWLAREERTTAVASRIPVPPHILLTGLQTRLVFGIIVVLLPLLVVALGCFVWWLRRDGAASPCRRRRLPYRRSLAEWC